MSTRDEIIETVIDTMLGHSLTNEQVTTLSDPVTSTDMSFTYGDITGMGRGIVEIGDELLYVSSAVNGAAEVLARGWQGSTPAAHAAGDLITVHPLIARDRVARMLNSVIGSMWPTLFGVRSHELTTGSVWINEVPAEAEAIVDVRIKVDGEWERVRGWESEREALSTLTGNGLRLPGVGPGHAVQVLYQFRPAELSSGASPWTDTGLDPSVERLAVLGVLADLAPSIDLARLTNRAAQARDGAQTDEASGTRLARTFRADFLAGLQAEAVALRSKFPARIHFTR